MRQKRRQGLLKRRHREGKTNYHKRLRAVSSAMPRLVVRKSLKNISAQLISYAPEGDRVVLSATTKELQKKYGWEGARRNTSAAYLTGYLLSIKARKANIKKAVFDIGMQSIVKGSILFGCLKGAIDGGMDIPHKESIFPSQERVEGKHLKQSLFHTIKGKIEADMKK